MKHLLNYKFIKSCYKEADGSPVGTSICRHKNLCVCADGNRDIDASR